MTDSTTELDPQEALELLHALDSLQDVIGAGNKVRGFHDEGDMLRRRAGVTDPNTAFDESDVRALRNYYVAKLALVMREASEAVEEFRDGRGVDEVYFSGGEETLAIADAPFGDHEPLDMHGNPRKPEGVAVELADVVIRCFDFADEAGFSLAEEIVRKLKYNATRGRMHGGKVI